MGNLRRALFVFIAFCLTAGPALIITPVAHATTNVSGTISSDTTWTAAGSPYVMTGNVTVSAGYTLTIQQGVVVKPRYTGTSLIVNGTLNATGAIFTSYKDDIHGGDTNGDGTATSPAPGDWRYLYFNGGAGTLDTCQILYGGYSIAALYILNSSSPTITNSLISDSKTRGVQVDSGAPSITNSTISNNQGGYGLYSATRLAVLSGNWFTGNRNVAGSAVAVSLPAALGQGAVFNNHYADNDKNAMNLYGDLTAGSGVTDWPASNQPYLVGRINVNNGSTLNIGPDTVVKMQSITGWMFYIYSGGTLNADGVTFTSDRDDANGGDTNGDGNQTQPAPGDWDGLYFGGGTGSITNCHILFGGNVNSAITIGNSSPVISGSVISFSKNSGISVSTPSTITNNTISNNQGTYGVDYYTSTAALPIAFHGNRIIDNPNAIAVRIRSTLGQGRVFDNTYSGNRQNAMFLVGFVTLTTDWPVSNSPYLFDSPYVSDNSTLTIGSGTIVKFIANASRRILVYAGSTLNADGVVFTSERDDTHGGDTNGDGSLTQPAPGDWGNIYFSGGGGAITNSTILYGGGGGVYDLGEIYITSGSSPTITGNAISNSSKNGIHVSSGTPFIHNNDIFTNSNDYYGLYSGVNIDATNNWWGGVGGPKPYGTGNAVNTDKVTASPWSDVPFTQAGAEAQAMGTDTWCGAYGEPVNTSTGAFFYEHTDMLVPTKGLPLEFTRTYNSNDRGGGPLGYGWSFNWQLSANPRTNGNVIILRGDGRQDTFAKNADGSYSPPAGRHDTLTKNADGTYKLVTSSQVTYNFGANNRLSSAVSETGQTTGFTYDANKRLVTITEPAGRTINITYNAAGRIDHISGPQGTTVSFLYSADGNLTQVTDQNGGITAYAYDAFHHITQVTDPNGHAFVNNVYDAAGRVSEQRDADGNLLTFAYDPAARLTTMTRVMDPGDPGKDQVTVHEYDAALRLTQETDPYGRHTAYTYDSAGNRDSVTDRRGVTTRSIFDAGGNVTDIYKAYGRPEEQHVHLTYNQKNHPLTQTDPRGQTTGYTYDATGTYMEQIAYPQVLSYDGTLSNYSEAFTYNADGTLATATDRNGDVTSYTYDSFGAPDVISRNTNRPPADQVTLNLDYDALGRRTAFTDGNGHLTTYEYNPIGDLRFVRTTVTNPETQLPENVVTEYQYDGNGNRTAVVDPEGKTTAFAYTAMDNLRLVTDARLSTIEHTYDAAYNRTATKDKNGGWTRFAFDKNNRLTQETDPENYATSFALDEEGNPVAVTDPLGRVVTRTYDALGRMTAVTEPDEGGAQRTTSYVYDAAGNLTATTDPLGHTYSQAYDELNRQKAATDPLANTVYTKYDGQGNRIKSKDQRGFETAFGYSANNWLTSVTDPLGSNTAYAFDKDGNLTSQTDALGHVTLYAHDELGRLTEEKVDAGGGSYLLEKDYVFDRAGHLTKDVTGEGTITYSYDNVYNVTAVTDRQGATYSFIYDSEGNRTGATDNGTGRTVSFSYSPRGLMSQSTDAHGASENFTYDGAGNLTQRSDTVAGQNFTTSFDHTPRNQVKSVTRGTDITSFAYDAAGNLATKAYPNGVTTSYSYDANDRLTAQSAQRGAETLQSFTQAFDASGNITSLTENGSLTSTYSYDQIDRLTAENIGGYGLISYAYDRAGNRLTSSNPTTGQTTYNYNQANQLTALVNTGQTTSFTYDTNGALAQKTAGSETMTYNYNGLDKLTQVQTPSTTVSYAYDALCRRISRTEGAGTQNYHLSGRSDLADYETTGLGTLSRSYLRGPDGLISTTDHTGLPTTAYNLYSPHGDTAGITDSQGDLDSTFRYDAIGNITDKKAFITDPITGLRVESPIDPPHPTYGYTGKWQREYDDATGAIRMGVREYDSTTGRFNSTDVLEGKKANPQDRNRYPYAFNSPLRFFDLDGREEDEGFWDNMDPRNWFDDDEEETGEQIQDLSGMVPENPWESGLQTETEDTTISETVPPENHADNSNDHEDRVLPPCNDGQPTEVIGIQCAAEKLSQTARCVGKAEQNSGIQMVEIGTYMIFQARPLGFKVVEVGAGTYVAGQINEHAVAPILERLGF